MPDLTVNDESNSNGKEKKQNKNRKTQAKTEKSSNNQRRSDPDANTKKVSKSGGGSRNWGNEGDEARRADKDEGYDGANNDAEDDAGDEEESEPEPVTFTLDEYMAQKASKKKDEKLFGAVKERAVDSKVEGKKVIDSEIDNYLVVGGLKENKLAKEKKERKTQVISVDLLSAPPASQSVFRGEGRKNSNSNSNYGNRSGDRGSGGRGGRDGRGDRGGRGGRGGGRGGRVGYSLDASAFPSL